MDDNSIGCCVGNIPIDQRGSETSNLWSCESGVVSPLLQERSQRTRPPKRVEGDIIGYRLSTADAPRAHSILWNHRRKRGSSNRSQAISFSYGPLAGSNLDDVRAI